MWAKLHPVTVITGAYCVAKFTKCNQSAWHFKTGFQRKNEINRPILFTHSFIFTSWHPRKRLIIWHHCIIGHVKKTNLLCLQIPKKNKNTIQTTGIMFDHKPLHLIDKFLLYSLAAYCFYHHSTMVNKLVMNTLWY